MDGAPGVQLIHLHGPRELIAERLAARKGHFMPPDLLRSQLETLETPGLEEGKVVSIAGSVEEVVDRCLGNRD
jgi:gluconokinase